MVAYALYALLTYCGFGLMVYVLARKGRPDDWDEALLASTLGPALLTILATAAAATLVWTRLRRPGPRREDRA